MITYGGDGVFAKIKSMILEDIAALEQQAKDDATEKGYCDGELAKTEAKKVELDDDIEALIGQYHSLPKPRQCCRGEVLSETACVQTQFFSIF